jgi:23S rRNA (guanosine2251-2'-O)-methyltransferase
MARAKRERNQQSRRASGAGRNGQEGKRANREPRRSAKPISGAVDAAVEHANLVVGRHPVLEALKAGRPINKILVSEASEGGSLIEILGKARAAGVVVQSVPKAHLQKIAGANHQGIVAYVAPREYVDLDTVLTRNTGQPPLVVLLDEVEDPYNFGAILRTCEAVGAQGVVIPKRRAVPLTDTVAKAAAGAVEYVPVARVANLVQAMERLKEAGYWIVGADVGGESLYTEVDLRGPIGVVIGAEGKGLSRLVKEHCDFLVRLPMKGQLQSLNASVAAGILLYEVVRQRG